MYAKVNTSSGASAATLLEADWVALPDDLVGLAQETLNDLTVLGDHRPDLVGIGYWPVVVNAVPDLVAGVNAISGDGTLTLQPINQNAKRVAAVRALTNDEIVPFAKIALAKSDVTIARTGEAISLGLNTFTSSDVVAFVNYRRTLRQRADGQGSGPLPTPPAFPVGS